MNMKFLSLAFLTFILAVDSIQADDEMVEFRIPISGELGKALQVQCQKRNHSPREQLMMIGVVFERGSTIQMDARSNSLAGKLTHSQALLLTVLSANFVTASSQEIDAYFDGLTDDNCFDSKEAKSEKVNAGERSN